MSLRWLFILCLAGVLLPGCSALRVPANQKPANRTRTAEKTPRPNQQENAHGIKVTRVVPVQLSVSDPDGIYLGDYIEATHLCTGEAIKPKTFSGSRYGTVKTYGTDHERYYQPSFPCTDSLRALLLCDDGCSATVILPVKVMPTGSRPATSPATRVVLDTRSLRLVTPSEGSRIDGMACLVFGEAPGFPEGTRLILKVENQHRIVYDMDDRPTVQNGQFTGCAYLGDKYGNGINENFRIYVVAQSGQSSSKVTVTRIK